MLKSFKNQDITKLCVQCVHNYPKNIEKLLEENILVMIVIDR